MGNKHSFDIVGKIDLQEMDNAINQTLKDISHRYDLKNSEYDLNFSPKEFRISIEAEDDFKLKAIKEIFHQKLIKRQISINCLDYEKAENSLSKSKQKASIQQGIPKEKAKQINKAIKEINSKVSSQIQDETIRVSGKSRDDLQSVIQGIKAKDFDCYLAFTNFK